MRRIIVVILAMLMLFASCAKKPSTDIEPSSKSDNEAIKSNGDDKNTVDDTHTEKEKEAFEIFSTLNKHALPTMFWYFADFPEDLNISTESEHAPYYKVGKFSTIEEMKSATNEVFTEKFSKQLFYDHAFTPMTDGNYMYKEIDGELYRNMDSSGMGWSYKATDEYQVAYMDDEKIIIAVKNLLPGTEEIWVNFLLRNENGKWKFDIYYDFNPYIEQDAIIATAVSSWICAENWNDVNELEPNSLINFYIYTYLSGVTKEYDHEIGYEVPSAKVMEELSVYFDNLKLETLSAINENEYASATYNTDKDVFYFDITFDPADFIVTFSKVDKDVTTLEVMVIGKDGKLSYTSYLDLIIEEKGFRFVEDVSAGASGYRFEGFKYVGNKI